MPFSQLQSSWAQKVSALLFPSNRRRDIDGLRGLAILLVIFFHAGWLKGGFIGVDIFIVISGYFMGRSAFMQHPFQAERFVFRRLYRLLPALLGMVAIVSAAMLWWVLPSDRADIAQNGAYALIYLSNTWASHHVGYFEGQSIAYPFLHTWSLSLEMQFYLVIFLIAWLLPKLKNRQIFLFSMLAGSFLYSLFATYKADHAAYYSLASRLCEFSLGTVIWLLPPLPQSRLFSAVRYAVALGVLLLCGIFYDLSAASPSPMVLLPCLAAMLIIMQPDAFTRRILEILSPIGVISYSLYLWHWPAIVCASYFAPVYGAKMALVLLGALVAGSLSYMLLERPLLAYEKAAHPLAVRRGGLLMIGLCGLLAAVLSWVSFVSRVH